MTGNPLNVINPANLVVDPATCKPIYPNQYIKVNTIFNVAGDHGLRTAWSDKHPAYEMLNGPSGPAVQDYFTPEINSQALGFPVGEDWTSDNAATMQYDSYKVRRHHRGPGRDDPDRPDHPGPARPEPERAAGRADRAHQGPSGRVTLRVPEVLSSRGMARPAAAGPSRRQG
jgi:hypothetical protein